MSMTSKGGNRQLQSFTHESACKCSANVNRSLGEKSDEEDMLTFQVSCTPSYSKLRKPIDFLKTAFAEITKPYGKRVAVERVSYVGKDTFLVKVSMNFLEVIKKLAERNDLAYASKKIKIFAIKETASSRYKAESSRLSSTYSPSWIEKDLKPTSSSFKSHGYSTKKCSKLEVFEAEKERVEGMHCETDGLGDSHLNYFEKNDSLHGVDIKPINVLDGRRITANSVQNMENKETHSILSLQRRRSDKTDTYQPAFGVEHNNIVEIYGNIGEVSEDALEMYLENRKRSGGGDIKEIHLQENPPRIVFDDMEAARRVVEKGVHMLSGKMFNMKFPVFKKEMLDVEKGNETHISSNFDCGNIIEIHGDIGDFGNDILEMYLESPRRSGGGEIEKLKMDVNPPCAAFRDSEAAKRVVEKGVHKFSGKTFYFKFPAEKTEGREDTGKVDGSCSTSNSDGGNIVEIHGDIGDVGNDSLGMYLESPRRSGGGKIEKLKLDVNPPCVVFRDSEAAKRVVEKGEHTFSGEKFHFKFPVAKEERKMNMERDSRRDTISNSDFGKTVEVHGEVGGLRKEHLLLYLESAKVSGGGKIKKINLDAHPPWVVFHDPRAATSAIMKGKHKVKDVSFQLKRRRITCYRDDAIILRNIKPGTSHDLLSMYVEKLCGSSPISMEHNHDKSAAMAIVHCKIDWIQLKEAHSKKPTLSDDRIGIEEVPVCTSAIMSNIPNTTRTEHLQSMIEKHCDNDSVVEFNYEKGQKFAHIRFHNPNAVQGLLKQKIKLEGKTIDIAEYNPSFITGRISKMIWKEPVEILINVNDLIMKHLLKNHKSDLCQRLGSEICTKKTRSNAGNVIIQPSFARRPDIPNQTEIFQSYYSEFVSREASVDVKDTSLLDIANSLCVTVHANPAATKIIVIGRKHDVSQFLEAADKVSGIRSDIELPPEKIKLLQSTRYLADLEKSLSVKIEADQDKLRVVGPESKIARLESKLNLKMQNIVHGNLPITDSIWKCLQNQEIFLKTSSLMLNLGVVFTVSEVSKTINFLAMSQKDLSNGIKRFKQTVVEKEVPFSDSEAAFIIAQKGSVVIEKLLLSKKFILLERNQKCYKFTGLADECSAAKDLLTKVLKENAFLTKLLPYSLGKSKAVLTMCKERIHKLLEETSDCQVSVNESKDKCSIKVSGYGKSVNYVAKQIEAIAKVIRKEDLVFQRPGLSKVIELESTKNMIRSLEKEKEVIILRKEDDENGTVFREETEIECSVAPDICSSTLICTYQRRGDVNLSLYKGDITKHKADIIVNPANSRLQLGGGVAGAILSEGGNSIQNECDRYVREHGGNLCDGNVAITGAGKLPCKKIIHAVGLQWPSSTWEIGEQELAQERKMSAEALAEVMVNVLEEAEKEGCRVLAVPAISSGIFGFPKELCAETLINATIDGLQKSRFRSLKEVHFISVDDPTVEVFSEKFTASFCKQPGFKHYRREEDQKKNPNNSVRRKPADRVKGKAYRKMQQREPDAMRELNREAGNSTSTNKIEIELVIGSLEKVTADVIVNSASSQLDMSANACALDLREAAGQSLQEECTAWVEANGHLPPYNFAETNGGKLNCKRVLHAVCEQYNGQESENELEKLIIKLLDAADKAGSKSIAIPGIGTGRLQFPKDNVAKIMVDCVRMLNQRTSLNKVMLVAIEKDHDMIAAFNNALKNQTVTNRSASGNANTSRSEGTSKSEGGSGSEGTSGIASGSEDMSRIASRNASTSANSSEIAIKIASASLQQKVPQAPALNSSVVEGESLVFQLGDIEMEIKCGDITKESTDAIVLLGSKKTNFLGAVGNAIKNVEGEEFLRRVRSKKRQEKGAAKLLKTSKLPSKFVAHICPKLETSDSLKSATKEMFDKCNSMELHSISLPAIGAVVMMKSLEESAELILHSLVELSIDNKVCHLQKVNIVLPEERLVSTFKKHLRENIKSLQKSPNNNTGVSAWIKQNCKISTKSLPSDNIKKGAIAEANYSNRNSSLFSSLAPVIFTVYFSHDKHVVKEVREKITKVLDDQIISSYATNCMLTKLPSHLLERIRSFGRKQDVLLELDIDKGAIKLSGYHRDIAIVTEYCHNVAACNYADDQKREKEQAVAKYVQWKERQEDVSLCDYNPALNYQIETQFQEQKDDSQIDIDDGNSTSTFLLDFSNKDEMKIISEDGKEEKLISREELAASSSRDLPSKWDPMPKDGQGLEAKVHCVQLQPNSQEFMDVSAKFTSTSRGQIHYYRIVKIERVQNPQLYKSYLAKKESMEKTVGQANINELELFHGTDLNSVAEINETGFNRSFAGVNGTGFGAGVYFATDASYSVRYAHKSGSLPRCMYLAKVLAGKYTGGNPDYKVAPKGFDTVVDNPSSPTIHVVFYDNQCYPEYLLHFR